MRILVTGSSGHLGEALCRVLTPTGSRPSGSTSSPRRTPTIVGSIADRAPSARPSPASTRSCTPRRCTSRTSARTPARSSSRPTSRARSRCSRRRSRRASAGSSTRARRARSAARSRPSRGAPANWITEDVAPVPRNIYGVTKVAAENVCELVHRDHGLPILILRTSRFFPEADDRDDVRAAYEDANLKVNELLYRRADLEDIVTAHRLALEKAPELGFGRYIISATTPFTREDLAELHTDAPAVVARHAPGYAALRAARLADVRHDRARLRQRGRAPRPRLDAALRLRVRARAARRAARSGAASSRSRSAPRATTPSRPGRTRSAELVR